MRIHLKLGLIAVMIMLSTGALAKVVRPTKATDAYRSAIAKAQELTLTQDRTNATKALVDALEQEPKHTRGYKELKKALSLLGEMFYTEKAQKIFEVGRSLQEGDPGSAVDKFSEAMTLEPGNFKIMREASRSLLAKGDCKKALETTKEALLANPFNTDFFLLRMQSKVCLGTVEDFAAELTNPYVEKESVSLYLELLHAQYLFNGDKYQAAVEALEKVHAQDKGFPETYFWLSKAHAKLGLPVVKDLETYVSLCKDAPAKIRERYSGEPRTCRDLKAAEQQLETIKPEGAT